MSVPPQSGPYGEPLDDGGRAPSTIGDVRRSELVLDRLAARAPLGPEDDGLLHVLAGWAAVVDAETEAATRPVGRRSRAGHVDLAVATTAGGLADGSTGTSTRASAAVRPVRPRRARRTPWWALSAGAAAVIAVMAVGLGAQDVTPAGPGTVAESVQSIEATLVAARLAAEQGDVAGARALLERARGLLEQLPATERAALADALVATEQGVASAEEAVRLGQPLPPWPEVPGLPDPAADGTETSVGPDDGPLGRPSDGPGQAPTPGQGGNGRPDRTVTPGPTATPEDPGTAPADPDPGAPPGQEPAPTTTEPAPTTTTTTTAPSRPTTPPGRPTADATQTGPGAPITVTAPPVAPGRGKGTRTQGATPAPPAPAADDAPAGTT